MSKASALNVTAPVIHSEVAGRGDSKQANPPVRAPRITASRSLNDPMRLADLDIASNQIDDAQFGVTSKGAPSTTSRTAEIAVLAQGAMALQNQRLDAYPTSGLINRSLVKRLFENANVKVDPQHTWMDEFNSATYDNGWQLQGQPTRSTSLADLVRNGFPADVDWENVVMDARAGVFAIDSRTGERTQLMIDIADLKNIVDEMHPLPRFQLEQLRQFWDKDNPQERGVHQQALLTSAHAWQAAHKMNSTGKISDTGLSMIRQAAGFPDGQVEDVRSYALDIGGYRAEDIAVLQRPDGRSVMVTPGDPVMFHEFADQQALANGLQKMARDPAGRSRLAFHFSLQDRTDTYKAGIDTLLGVMAAQGKDAQIRVLGDRAEITGDVFDWAARGQCAGRLAEAEKLLAADAPYDADTNAYLDRRGTQLFPASPGAVPGSARTKTSPASDPWLASLNQALASGNPSWWASPSGITEPTLTGIRALPVERQRDLAQRQFTLEAVERQIATLEPDMQASAHTFMQEKLREHFRFTGDPDQTVLVEYERDHFFAPVLDPQAGPNHAIAEPKAGRIAKVTPLSQLPLDSMPFSTSQSPFGDAAQTTGRFAVRAAGDVPRRWTPGMASLLPVKELARIVRSKDEFDFESRMLKGTDDFFLQYGRATIAFAQQKALLTADLMLAQGKLSPQDHQLARSGFGVSPQAGAAHAVARADVSTHEFDIDGRVSLDLLRIEDKNTKRTLLYLPGEETPIKGFANRRAAVDWLVQMHADPAATDRFVADHFSAANARAGVASFMHAPAQSSFFNREKFLNGTADINNQPFAWLSQRQHAQLKDDLKETITSPGDASTNWWIDALDKTPISYLPAAAKSVLAPTFEQRRQGLKELGMEALMDVFGGGALRAAKPVARGVSTVWKKMRELSNHVADNAAGGVGSVFNEIGMKAPKRINGKLGYLLGDPNPPRLPATTIAPSPAAVSPTDSTTRLVGSNSNSTASSPTTSIEALPSSGSSPVSPHSPGQLDGTDNHGFVHSADDPIPGPALRPKRPDSIALHVMGSSPVPPSGTRSVGTQSHIGIPIGTQTVSSVANADRLAAPTAEQISHAYQLIRSHGQAKSPAPAWLQRPDWLTDNYVREKNYTLPGAAESVEQMIENQKKSYADLLDLNAVHLANAYNKDASYSEISSLLDMQSKTEGKMKSQILSQWAQLNPADPMTRLEIQAIATLSSNWPILKQQTRAAVERLTRSQAMKQQELATFLSQNMSNNSAVLARQTALQKQLDDEFKVAIDELRAARTRYLAATTIVGSVSGVAIGSGIAIGNLGKGKETESKTVADEKSGVPGERGEMNGPTTGDRPAT